MSDTDWVCVELMIVQRKQVIEIDEFTPQVRIRREKDQAWNAGKLPMFNE